MNLKTSILAMFAACGAFTASAVSANAPDIVKISGQAVYVSAMSDNGLWGLTEKASTEEGSIAPSGGVRINFATMEMTDVSDSRGLSGVADITDDGKVIVGECRSVPAYYSFDTNAWTRLPLPSGSITGRLGSVTPDGHYAVGYVNPGGNIYQAEPVMYDLQKGEIITLPNLPVYDMNHFASDFHRFIGISADGRYVLGEMSFIYMSPTSMFSYVYDRQTETYNVIGFTESLTSNWRPDVANVNHCDGAVMSANGHWVTGSAYMVKDIAGSQFANEYSVAFRYNVLTDEFEIYDGNADSDYAGGSISNDGVVYAYTPYQNPSRSAAVRHGDYYYSFNEIFRQAYGINFEQKTGFETTGLPCAVSADGKTLLMLYYIDESYLIKLKEPLADVLDNIDLLANYTIDPVSGSTMTSIGTVTLRFDRNVAVAGLASSIELRDENGQKLRSPANNGFAANNQTITITFRTQQIPQGKTYSVYIPAGMISIAGDSKITNKPIEIFYNGRGSAPVALKSAYPANGSSVATIDASANPLILTFNSDIKLASSSTVAKLYRDDESDPFCDLYGAVSGNMLQLYPLAAQNLFKDTEYNVIIPAGMVTDLSGNGGNEEMGLHYFGTYVRQISSDDIYLFSDECESYDQFMFYEGDHRTPQSTVADWGFTADSTPWYIASDDNTYSNMFFASHSMYTPAGQADDWVVIPQLFIPDVDCYLSFLSQSYLPGKTDRLKVYVYQSDDVYNVLNETIIENMRTKGDLVYNEVQDPGEKSETTEGEWRQNTVTLEKYAGKNIYIAFVNDNNDQSAVFIDNVQVIHDMKYLVSFSNQDRVVNQESIAIRGTVSVQSEISKYSKISMVLKDADGKTIDQINESGLSLAKGDTYSFAFDALLPLAIGAVNNFTIEMALDNDKSVISSSVRNLVFSPTKRVVLEEYSGADCSNCPLGFAAMDNLIKLYSDRILPVVIRMYGGDTELAVGLENYHNFLGMQAAGAPSGRVNRGNTIYPMIQSNGEYLFSGAGIPNTLTGRDEECWLDHVRTELASAADAEVSIKSAVNTSSSALSLSVDVRPALTLSKQSLNLFAVVVEDNVETYQSNGFRSIASDNLGDWGANGIYGGQQYVYPFMLNHCARATGGATYNGTGGLVPSDLKAGETYNAKMTVALPQSISNINNCHVIVMLIDAGTGKVVNANISPVNGESLGIGDAIADEAESAIEIVAVGSTVSVTDANNGDIRVAVYNVSGAEVAAAAGAGNVALDLYGRNGVFFVKAVTANGQKVQKVLIR